MTVETYHGMPRPDSLGVRPLSTVASSHTATKGADKMIKRLTAAQRELLGDLAGGAEIAEALGVSRAVVSMWAGGRYEDFPQPVVTLAAGRFYRLSEVLAWHAQRAQQ